MAILPGEPADPPSPPSVARITLEALAVVLGAALALWTLHKLASVLLLLVLALFFAYVVAPLVSLARRPLMWRGRSRSLPLPAAIGLVYLLIFGSLAAATWLVLPVVGDQFSDLASEAPAYVAKAQAKIQAWQRFERAHLSHGMQDAVNAAIEQSTKGAAAAVQSGLLPLLAAVLGYLPWLVLVPILALFLLKDAEVFRQAALRAFPVGRARWRGNDFFEDVNATLAAYVRAQIVACLIVGAACGTGFALIGVPYAVVLGIAAGIAEFIPLAGPLAIAAIAILLAATHSWGEALATFAFLAILRILEDYVVYPRLIGRGIDLHPVAVILAILAGAEIGGLAGIFLSIPAVAVLSIAVRHWREHRRDVTTDG